MTQPERATPGVLRYLGHRTQLTFHLDEWFTGFQNKSKIGQEMTGYRRDHERRIDTYPADTYPADTYPADTYPAADS